MPTTGLPLPGLIVGDSIGDESDEYPARISWPNQNNCVAGYGYVNDIQPAFATTLANKPNGCAFAILQGGVNDLGDNYDEDDIAAAVTSMITAAQADGLEVVVVSMSPFGGNGGWNATKQTRLDAYNSWLFANAASLGVVAVDIYSILEDDVTADYLEADYDPGDGLHPNGAGQIVIANAIDTALDSLGLYASVQNVNIETWKGAVEPGRAGPGTTGQILLWKGAVQPTDYGTIPDLSGLDEAAASAAITAAGFAVGTITNTGSGGTVIAQSPAASTEQLLESSVDFTVELAESNSGGWLNTYNAYQQRKAAQERARKEILKKVRELDGIDGEIAELMQLDQAREDEDKRIQEFRALLETEISKAELDRAGLLNARINRAYDRAMKKATFSAIEALEREIEDAIEEEDFLFIVMSIQ